MNPALVGRLLTLCVLLGSPLAGAGAADLVLNVSPTGFPPYMIFDPATQVGSGIMVDVLRVAAGRLGYGVKLEGIPRNRVAQSLENRTIDVTPRAKQWEEDPSLYVFSIPVIETGNSVFSQAGRPLRFQKTNELAGRHLVTRLGFASPELENLFQRGGLLREDAPDESSMLRMVHAGRVDGAVVDEAVGRYLLPRLALPAESFTIVRGDFPRVGATASCLRVAGKP